MKRNIAIIGAGRIGGALFGILRKKHDVFLWDKRRGVVKNQGSLEDIISPAEFIFLCTPPSVSSEILSVISPFISNKTIVISFSKGIEEKTGMFIHSILSKFVKSGNFCFFGGPMLSEEIEKGGVGIGILGAPKKSVFLEVSKLFSGTPIATVFEKDIKSVAISGTLKNIYSVALGMADGLRWNTNQKGWFVSRILEEMVLCGKILGARDDVLRGPAGLGDLITCGINVHSRNRSAGEKVIKSGLFDPKSEAVHSLTPLRKILGKKIRKFPILNTLILVAFGKKDPKKSFSNLF